MLLFNAAHHHAEMAGFDDDTLTLRLDGLLNAFSNLHREAFLHLQTTREHIDQARNLAEPDHLPIRDVGDVHLSEKRQKVMLAETEHLHVFYDDHFVILFSEE